MFYTYIIQSQKDFSFYIGFSSNPAERLIQHNSSSSGYTSKKQPWKLVFIEAFNSKSEAIKREKFLKKQKNRTFYLRLINSDSNFIDQYLNLSKD